MRNLNSNELQHVYGGNKPDCLPGKGNEKTKDKCKDTKEKCKDKCETKPKC